MLNSEALAALIVAVQVGEQIPQGGNPAAEAAGIGGEDTTVVDARLVGVFEIEWRGSISMGGSRGGGSRLSEGPDAGAVSLTPANAACAP